MLNSELTKSDDTIHLFLMIVIVVVAVSVSVSVTAGLSICIIRCKDRRNASHTDGVNPPCKCVTEHGHYMCSSQQPSYWPDDAVAQSTEPESSQSLTRRSRRGPHQGGELGNGQKTADSVYQEIGGRENVHKQFMTPDCHSEREDGWSIGDTEHSQEGQDFNSSHHYKPLSSQTGQSSHKKPKQQSCFYPGDTNNISRPLHKPNIGHIPDCLLSFTRVVTPEDAGSYELGFVVKDSGTPALSATTTLSLMLTVTNQTSEVSNTIQSQSDEKVHQQLFIIIVLIAVAVSVPITAAMSICIIRCNGRRNASHQDSLNPPCKCVTEHGNYMCPSQQPRYWPDDVAQSADPELTRSLTRRSKRELHQGGEQGNGQKTADGMYQEIGGKSCGRENGHKQFMSPDCLNEREDGLSGGDAGHCQDREEHISPRTPEDTQHRFAFWTSYYQLVKKLADHVSTSVCITVCLKRCLDNVRKEKTTYISDLAADMHLMDRVPLNARSQVIAKDGGSPPKQSVLDVHISITDVNDNTPVFSQNVYNVSIKYEYNEAIPITVLSARDLDSVDQESTRTMSRRSARGPYPTEELNKGLKTADGVYQEIVRTSRAKENEHKQFMNPDCLSEREDGWNGGGDIENGPEGLDLNTSQPFKSPSSMIDQIPHKSTQKKSKQQTHFYPGNTNHSSSRSLCKPNIGHIPDCSQWIDLKPAAVDNGISGPYSQLCNLTENKNSTSSSHQRVTVPHAQYLDYLG
ncbi:PCDHD2 [Acanthosepion pharaonis]|uniref:PCDHD2 n=1 Tax=Acanthosepion pharaonis TaxID=158019 RepID=A0A812CHR1_ACAPH|nr:PCDHD2 [Sepia pharaonis]